MKRILFAIAFWAAFTVMGHAQSIYSNGGHYLGEWNNNRFDPNSVSNPFGQYGSQFSPDSIFNQFGQYGSKFATDSVFNPYTVTPPTVYAPWPYGGSAPLTVNPFVPMAVKPLPIPRWW